MLDAGESSRPSVAAALARAFCEKTHIGRKAKATRGVRTPDLALTKRMLYQLSYGGIRDMPEVQDNYIPSIMSVDHLSAWFSAHKRTAAPSLLVRLTWERDQDQIS